MSLTKPRHSLLLHGFTMVLRNLRAVLWTYACGLALALVFALRLHAQLASVLNKSLAAERLNTAFDLGTVGAVAGRLQVGPATGGSAYLGQPLYLLALLVLVPGALFCFHTQAPATLRMLVNSGLKFFWRFVRIGLLTAVCGGLLVGLAATAAGVLRGSISERMVGWPALRLEALVWLVVFLLAALVRLYFDVVEAYTMLLDDQILPDGFPDRRVRRALLPAARALGRSFLRAYAGFLLLAALGLLAFAVPSRTAMHMLAQPRVWPMFLQVQAGLLLLLFCRFWQRGLAMALALESPLAGNPHAAPGFQSAMPEPYLETAEPDATDPLPDPEPVSPSLSEPDPGIFEGQSPEDHRQ